jgi:type IV secretory pathway VirB10-like protein
VKASEAMPSLDFDHFRSSCATDQTTGQKQQGILLSDQTKTEKADRKRKRQKKDTRAMTRSAPAAQKKEAQKKQKNKQKKDTKNKQKKDTKNKQKKDTQQQKKQKKDTHFTRCLRCCVVGQRDRAPYVGRNRNQS